MIRDHIRSNIVGYLALFVALGGGTAFAADTVFSEDIVDGQVFTNDISNSNGVRSADVRDDTAAGGGLAAVDLAPGSVAGSEIAADAVDFGELAPDSVRNFEIAAAEVRGSEIAENAVGSGEIVTAGVGSAEIATDGVGSRAPSMEEIPPVSRRSPPASDRPRLLPTPPGESRSRILSEKRKARRSGPFAHSGGVI